LSKGDAMIEQSVIFDDGSAYEQMMGTWSRLTGEIFLDWLRPSSDLRWIDVGCGNGASTELIVGRCAPSEVQGVDPSDAQLSYARKRPDAGIAQYNNGDAVSLAFPDNRFDVALMALVIFFIPDPPKGVAEMVRVVAPGGLVAAYAWDVEGGGNPLQPLTTELVAMGFPLLRPPSFAASRTDALQKIWTDAGLIDVETRRIDVQRTFTDFDDFWRTITLAAVVAPTIKSMSTKDLAQLKTRLRAQLPRGKDGRITYGAFANAVRGRVPN
jgi:ubiquinone/menaquinone biosynthesis C-methylase UbiE